MIQVTVIVNVQSHETVQYLVTLLTDMCSASHIIECSRNHFYRPQSLRRLCFYTCLSFCPLGGGGWWYPSMPCRWYPSMPSRSPGGYPSMPCRFPGPHPRGSLRGLATWGVYPSMHLGRPPTPTADGYCCGRYASFWNASLCLLYVFSHVELDLTENTILLEVFRIMCYTW